MSGYAIRFGAPGATGPTAAFEAAMDALRAGREEEGLRRLQPAVRAAPGEARLWQAAGLLYRQMEALEPAIDCFGKAAALAPRDARIAHGRARCHLEAGLPSVDLFREANALAPEDGEILLGLVAALEDDVAPAAAIDELERILAEHPAWLPGIEALTRLRFQCGQRDRYTEAFDRVLAAHPRDVMLWRAFIILLSQSDRYDEMLEAVMRARSAAGHDLIFDANEAVARAELGQTEAADLLFSRLADVDDATLQVRRVRHLLRSGRPEAAAAVAEPRAAGPDGGMFWPYVSIAWRLTGDPRRDWLEGDERLVSVVDLGDRLPSLDALAARLRALHRTTHQPIEQSVRGGTQTQGPLFSRIKPEIKALRAAVVEAVEAHVAQLPPPDPAHPTLAVPRDRPVRFAGAWSVRLTGGGHHANHIHPMGWFSSALYVALPKPEPDAPSSGPQPGWLTLGAPQAELGIDLPAFRSVEPKPGRLVLFPSTLWHGTVPFAAGERLTVAFDVAPPRAWAGQAR